MKNIRVFSLCSLLILAFAVACNESSNIEIVENKDDDGRLIEKYSRSKDNFAKQGFYQAFYTNGNILEEANYEKDVLHGERKLFLSDGTLDIVEHYNFGQFSGLYEKYYPNGQVKFTGEYTNNVMAGLWKGYYQDGTLKEEVTMKNNEENGPFKEYHPSGALAVEGNFQNGPFEEGELKEYDDNGGLIARKLCHLGLCKEIWTSEKGAIEIDKEAFFELAEKMKAIE